MTFATDIFHPLITPLTTYTYTTNIQDNGTVSATDEERLPPGGFSLRHGFPAWFGRSSRNKRLSSSAAPTSSPLRPQTPPRATAGSGGSGGSAPSTPASSAPSPLGPFGRRDGGSAGRSGARDTIGSASASPEVLASPSYVQTRFRQSEVSTYAVLRYIRSAFDDAAVLDAIPLEAAGNPGAWNAWRTHRRQQARTSGAAGSGSDAAAAAAVAAVDVDAAANDAATAAADAAPEPPRKPGEWNWEHVWEERVQKGIRTSLSDPVLFGSAGAADDVVREPGEGGERRMRNMMG